MALRDIKELEQENRKLKADLQGCEHKLDLIKAQRSPASKPCMPKPCTLQPKLQTLELYSVNPSAEPRLSQRAADLTARQARPTKSSIAHVLVCACVGRSVLAEERVICA